MTALQKQAKPAENQYRCSTATTAVGAKVGGEGRRVSYNTISKMATKRATHTEDSAGDEKAVAGDDEVETKVKGGGFLL